MSSSVVLRVALFSLFVLSIVSAGGPRPIYKEEVIETTTEEPKAPPKPSVLKTVYDVVKSLMLIKVKNAFDALIGKPMEKSAVSDAKKLFEKTVY
uniref:Uncharacterized protein n=1 Tax=Trichobilharzia regenti TaxID=157069 RepID=A0AA85J3A1_TRIRE|nr:unnamed protein product [Trichobilharzia regenti]